MYKTMQIIIGGNPYLNHISYAKPKLNKTDVSNIVFSSLHPIQDEIIYQFPEEDLDHELMVEKG